MLQRIAGGEDFVALAGDVAQHRVGQRGEARTLAIETYRPHRQVDGGMIGDVEQQDLCRADDQRPLQFGKTFRQSLVEETGDGVADRPEPAQRGGDDGARQRPVAVVERRQAARHRDMGKALLEQVSLGDDVLQDERRGDAGHQSRMLLRLGALGRRLRRGVAGRALPPRSRLHAGSPLVHQITPPPPRR